MRRILSILACCVGLTALPAHGQTAETDVTVEPACVESGGSFTVFATGLQPGGSYDFLIDPVPAPLEAGGIVEADHTGVGVLDGTIPDNVDVETGEFTWSVAPSEGGATLAAADFRIAALCPVTERGSGTFVDDDGSTHEGNIEAIAHQEITLGCNPPDNDRFCPDEDVTRVQMAAFLVRALDLEASDTDVFVDDDDRALEADINALAAAEITLGCNPDGDRFCPDDPVTRGQMAAFLVRAFGYTNPESGNRFVDDDDSPFESQIEALAAAGVTLGCNPPDGDRFCPNDFVARDQMASFLGRALDLAPRPQMTLEPRTDDRQSEPFPGERGAQLAEVRTEQHGFFDRVVFEFDEVIPGWSTQLQDPPLLGDPSGLEISIEGDAFLAVTLNPAAAQWASGDYDGPDRIDVAGAVVTEVVEYSDFEGVNSWAIGLDADAAYAVASLTNPARLVIDVMHG